MLSEGGRQSGPWAFGIYWFVFSSLGCPLLLGVAFDVTSQFERRTKSGKGGIVPNLNTVDTGCKSQFVDKLLLRMNSCK